MLKNGKREKNCSHTTPVGVAETPGAAPRRDHVDGDGGADLLEGSTDTVWERSSVLGRGLQRGAEQQLLCYSFV